jgi:hypothetical protein
MHYIKVVCHNQNRYEKIFIPVSFFHASVNEAVRSLYRPILLIHVIIWNNEYPDWIRDLKSQQFYYLKNYPAILKELP